MSPASPSPAFSSFRGLFSTWRYLEFGRHTSSSGPPGRRGGPGHPYLWLCGLPPWGTCPLPTTCASEFPDGCSPATGEWPDQTRPGRRSLWVTGEPRTQDMSAPVCISLLPPRQTSLPPCPHNIGGEGQGSPRRSTALYWLRLRTLRAMQGTRRFHFPSLHADWHAQSTAKTPAWVK